METEELPGFDDVHDGFVGRRPEKAGDEEPERGEIAGFPTLQKVDGARYPLSLLGFDADEKGHLEEQVDTRAQVAGALAYQGENLMRGGEDITESRSLYRDEGFESKATFGSYEDALGIANRKFPDLLEAYLQLTGKDKARVLDLGCGEGKALGEILELDLVDRDASMGITLPGRVDSRAEGRVVHEDIMTVRSKPGVTKKANVVMSILAGIKCHPTNKYSEQGADRMLAILHAISFLEDDGLLLTPDAPPKQIDLLSKRGILYKPSEFDRFAEAGDEVQAFVLKKRPSDDEMKELLGVK